MFTYTATISQNLAPAGLIPSQLTFRSGWNISYNDVSDRVTNELKANQLTSCNHPLTLTKPHETFQIFIFSRTFLEKNVFGYHQISPPSITF